MSNFYTRRDGQWCQSISVKKLGKMQTELTQHRQARRRRLPWLLVVALVAFFAGLTAGCMTRVTVIGEHMVILSGNPWAWKGHSADWDFINNPPPAENSEKKQADGSKELPADRREEDRTCDDGTV